MNPMTMEEKLKLLEEVEAMPEKERGFVQGYCAGRVAAKTEPVPAESQNVLQETNSGVA